MSNENPMFADLQRHALAHPLVQATQLTAGNFLDIRGGTRIALSVNK